MGRITTHVLDTAHGQPGQGVAVSLYKVVDNSRQLVTRTATNSDGRCDQPLAQGEALSAGVYELDFSVGDYFAKLGVRTTEPAFLGVVTLRFGVADAQAHYHVPLVVTPWSYSTYRGS